MAMYEREPMFEDEEDEMGGAMPPAGAGSPAGGGDIRSLIMQRAELLTPEEGNMIAATLDAQTIPIWKKLLPEMADVLDMLEEQEAAGGAPGSPAQNGSRPNLAAPPGMRAGGVPQLKSMLGSV